MFIFYCQQFNPFHTKPMAKIAVKMSIMRVVKFMSSWDNDFMSWPKHHQLFFRGQSVELPLSLHWFSWLPPGGYQGLSMWEIWSKHSQSFDVLRTLTATGVKGYGNRVTCISQVMRPQGPLMPCTPQVLPSNTVRDSQSKVEKCQILVYGPGGNAPCDLN